MHPAAKISCRISTNGDIAQDGIGCVYIYPAAHISCRISTNGDIAQGGIGNM